MQLESHQEIILAMDSKKGQSMPDQLAPSSKTQASAYTSPLAGLLQKTPILTVSAQQRQVTDASFLLLKVKWTSALLARSSVREHWEGKWGGPILSLVGTSRGHPIQWSDHQDLTGICLVLGRTAYVLFHIHLSFLHWSYWFREKWSTFCNAIVL